MGTKTGKEVFRHALCVNCCDCAYFADKFNSELADLLDEPYRHGWNVESPDPVDPVAGHGWEIEYHRLNIEASESLLRCTYIHPNINGDDDFSTTIEVTVGGGAPEDNARICFNYKGPDNYYYVEVEWGTTGSNEGIIRYGERSSGVDSDTDSKALGPSEPPFPAAGGAVKLRICIDESGGSATVTITSNHGFHWAPTLGMSDSRVALGAGWGTPNTGIVWFDDFRLWDTAIADTDPNCPSCDPPPDDEFCENCDEGSTPWTYQVVIAGFAEPAEDACGDCVTLNDTYFLTAHVYSHTLFAPELTCIWLYTFPVPVCGFQQIALLLSPLEDHELTCFLLKSIDMTLSPANRTWSTSLSGEPPWNCGFSNKELTLNPDWIASQQGPAQCDGDGSTCKVTAV